MHGTTRLRLVALRNIDHLASSTVEAPAFVLDQRMMNSGVMLLAPSAAEHARMATAGARVSPGRPRRASRGSLGQELKDE